MEFNRLLSSVISTYGEPELSSKNIDIKTKENKLSSKLIDTISEVSKIIFITIIKKAIISTK